MPMVTVNSVEVEVDKGTSILQAAAQAGFAVPHFCYHPALSSPANCRMCLVEVEGAHKLLPGCYNSVNDGMVVLTESERVHYARKAVLEFILVNHPVDCPICDKAGECKLQDYYFAYDAQESRMRAEKQHKVKAYPIGPKIVYDGERCILCTRCIRFCDEITGTSELTLIDRGDKTEVRTFPGMELDNDYSLCTVDICPVGALTSRDFRFKCRVWLLTSTDSICTGCEMGCNVHMDHFRNEVQRYRPRYNPEVNDYWICDRGRMTYKRIHEDRFLQPMNNGAEVNWHSVSQTVADKLGRVIESHGADAVALVLSPQASCEDLYLAKRFHESALEGAAPLYVNGYALGDSDDLLKREDKNPNRRGIEAVWAGMEGIQPFEDLQEDLANGTIKAVYMMGTELPIEGSERAEFVSHIEGLELFILQAMNTGGELIEHAHIALPACSHAEKDGTFVNVEGLAQPFYQAFAPHGDSMPDWQIFSRLARRMGHTLSLTSLHQIQEKMFEATKLKQEAEEKARLEAEAQAKAAKEAEEKAAKEAAEKAAAEAAAAAEAEQAAEAAPEAADGDGEEDAGEEADDQPPAE